MKYTFSYSGFKSDKSIGGSGILKLEVVENFENGTLRIAASGSLNNAEFLIRKNVAEDRFSFPYLITLPQLDQTLTRENGTITISIERLDDEEVEFRDANWVLNVSRITLQAEGTRNGKRITVNLDGTLKIFATSGLLHSFTGDVKATSPSDTQIEASIILTDTNLDLSVKPESSPDIFSQVGTLMNMEVEDGAIPFDSQAPPSQSPATTPPYLLIGGLIGAITLVSLLSVMGWRRRERHSKSEEKPLHWVH